MISKIITCFSYVYPLKLISFIKICNRYLLSEKIRRRLYVCGTNFKVGNSSYIRGGEYIEIGENFWADEKLMLQCWDKYSGELYNPELLIGDNVHMGSNCHVGCINKIKIGNNVLFGRNVHITDHNHGDGQRVELMEAPINRKLYSKGEIIIEDNVWIGDNVVILPGVIIGKGAVVGANAVVTHDVMEFSVVAGVPATIIRNVK